MHIKVSEQLPGQSQDPGSLVVSVNHFPDAPRNRILASNPSSATLYLVSWGKLLCQLELHFLTHKMKVIIATLEGCWEGGMN